MDMGFHEFEGRSPTDVWAKGCDGGPIYYAPTDIQDLAGLMIR